jgi:hypothetical protein
VPNSLGVKSEKGIMKSIKLLTLAACAFALVAGSLNVQASCCDDAKKAGKECAHKCCVEATKAKKVCEKCNPKAENKDAKK